MEFQEKNVLVFGSGKSGIAAAELLEKQNANIFVFEGNEKQSVAEIKEKSESFAKAEIYVGTLPEEVMDKLDFVVLSPGVPTELRLLVRLSLLIRWQKEKSLQLQERMARRQPLHWWEKFYPITLRM